MTKRERFVLWLNRFYHKQNKIMICVLYVLIMAILGVLIYGANQQRTSSNVSVKYSRPSYTVSFDANGGSLTSSTGGGVISKQVRLGDAYGDLPTPTRSEHDFLGWTLNSTTITSSTQNKTVGNHTLVASWKIWPDLPSSAGATFVNTQALQNSSGGRNKRVVQINTTKNASGTARTYKYSWDGTSWSTGASLVEKTSTGDQTLYVRVYPTGGEHYRNYVQTSIVVHLNKLPVPQTYTIVRTGMSGYWKCRAKRMVSGSIMYAKGCNCNECEVTSWAAFTTDDWITTGSWTGWIWSMTNTYYVYAYHALNGFVDSDTQTQEASGTSYDGSKGSTTYYYAQDDGTLTT